MKKPDWKKICEAMLADQKAIQAYFQDPVAHPLPERIKFAKLPNKKPE